MSHRYPSQSQRTGKRAGSRDRAKTVTEPTAPGAVGSMPAAPWPTSAATLTAGRWGVGTEGLVAFQDDHRRAVGVELLKHLADTFTGLQRRRVLGAQRHVVCLGNRLQLRYEAFNFLNTPQFAAPSRTLGSADFGRITSTVINNREMQFGLKYLF